MLVAVYTIRHRRVKELEAIATVDAGADQVSRDSSHPAPVTHASADIRPLNRPPFKIIPAEIGLAVLLLNPSRLCSRLPVKPLPLVSEFLLVGLNAVLPILMPIPPHLVPKLLVGVTVSSG